ncbi:hypothetical protein CDD83_2718 [Cordyceps sp. RAO-2017]|nr:hypothetical protein CDD83_2718 [Cordyceps sp. RAO-2017]
MRGSKYLVGLICLPSVALGLIKPISQPVLDLKDKRFLQHRKPGPGDSRSPCPLLNSCANHGFLPRNGRNIDVADIVLGLFLCAGISPELSAIIFAFGIVSSHNALSLRLDLEDLRSHHLVIEHDCSFSRNDDRVGDNNNYQADLWDVAMVHLNHTRKFVDKNKRFINPLKFGRAKAARVTHQKQLNPNSVWGPRAWFNGFSEVGLILSAFGDVPGLARLDYIRSVFEEEKLPYHLGWRPRPFYCNTATMLAVGAASVLGDDKVLKTAAGLILHNPSELLEVFVPPRLDHLPDLENKILDLGFNPKPMKNLSKLLRKVSEKSHFVRSKDFIGPRRNKQKS